MSAAEASLSSNPTALLFYAAMTGDTAQAEEALNAGASASNVVRMSWNILEHFIKESTLASFCAVFSMKAARESDSIISPPRPPLYFAVKKRALRNRAAFT